MNEFESKENEVSELRHLATVVRIDEVKTHPNADALDIVRVKGWRCVAKRDEFKVGDLAIYCEIDSILPDVPEFEFMKARHFRVRTIKLRGEISQGLCIHPQTLADGPSFKLLRVDPNHIGFSRFNLDNKPIYGWENPDGDFPDILQVGQDVTEQLRVKKHVIEIPAQLKGLVKGNFPSFLRKTDEVRIQSEPELLQQLDVTRLMWYTEKLDGTSITVYQNQDKFGVCSRNLELCETENNVYWKTVKQQGVDELLATIHECGGGHFALQGELVGPGIQGNKYNLDKPTIFWFNVYDIDHQRLLNINEMVKFFNGTHLEIVPVLNKGSVLTFMSNGSIIHGYDVDCWINQSIGVSQLNPQVQREGIVVRGYDKEGNIISFKAINPQFLLKYE